MIAKDKIQRTAGANVDLGDVYAVSDDMIRSVTTTATPASGSCGVQFVFKDGDGNPVASVRSLICYLTNSAGATHTAAITSVAALTNGAATSLVTGKATLVTTSAAGLLGLTLTGAAATYYVAFILPGGKVLISGACTIS